MSSGSPIADCRKRAELDWKTIYPEVAAIPLLTLIYSEGRAVPLIIIPDRSIERRVFSGGFQPLEVVVDGHIGVDIGVCQGEFFLPGMKLVDPPAVRKY